MDILLVRGDIDILLVRGDINILLVRGVKRDWYIVSCRS